MKRGLYIVGLLMTIVTLAVAAEIKVKYTGPSGQGDQITYSSINGNTNMVVGTNGNVTIPGTLSCGITNIITCTGLVIAGNSTNTGTTVMTGAQTLVGATAANNVTIATNLAYSASSGNVTHNGNLTIATNLAYSASSGNVTHNGNLIVSTNLTITGTSLHTGVATFTAQPVFNAARIAAGGLTNGPVLDLPDTVTGTNGIWISIKHGSTNLVVRAYPTS